jgi:hypothetical protein
MKKVVLIGGGYSVKEGIEKGLWDVIKNEEIWSLNYAWKTMPYLPKKQLWVDATFFKDNIAELQKLYQAGVECHSKKNNTYSFLEGIVQHVTTREINDNKNIFIGQMGLVGMFALSYATKLNYEEIYLLGYDFGTSNINNKLTHYYQGKIRTMSTGVGNPEVYLHNDSKVKREVNDFYKYKDYKTIYNVSPNSNIQCFPKLTYEQFFSKIRGEVNE